MKPNYIRDDGRESKYFHQMLNMMDEDLNPYQYRLMGHYKRVCGESSDGACWESTRTTAVKCKMSAGKVSKTRRELQQLGYITIEDRADDTLYITVIDRMAENIARYANRSPEKQSVHEVNGSVHTVNTRVHEVNQRITTEKEPSKKNNSRKSATTSTSKEKDTTVDVYIKAWLDGQKTTPARNQYGNKTVRSCAAAIAAAGYTPEQLTRYVKHLSLQPYWQDKLVLFTYIADNMAAYIATLPPRIIPEKPLEIVPKPPEDDQPATPEQIEQAKRLWSEMLKNTNANTKAKGA